MNKLLRPKDITRIVPPSPPRTRCAPLANSQRRKGRDKSGGASPLSPEVERIIAQVVRELMTQMGSCKCQGENGPILGGLATAGSYCTGKPRSPATVRWARRHLVPHIPHYHLPGTGIIFKKSDIDSFLEKYRVDPSAVVESAVRKATSFIQEVEDR